MLVYQRVSVLIKCTYSSTKTRDVTRDEPPRTPPSGARSAPSGGRGAKVKTHQLQDKGRR